MAESIQHKLSRVRPPRVQITYDVEIGDAIQKKELPFVIGIMSDLSADSKGDLPRPADRKFVEIDRDNFDKVMEDAAPKLSLSVPNHVEQDEDGNTKEGTIPVELEFKTFDDFNPKNLIANVGGELEKLFHAREALRDLSVKLDGNDELEENLMKVIEGEKDTLLQLLTQDAEAHPAPGDDASETPQE